MEDILRFLKQIRTKRRELGVLQRTMAELRFMLLPSGIRYDKDKVQTSPEDKMSELVEELMSIESQEQMQIVRLKADLDKVETLIGAMPTPEYRELIRLRYVAGGLKPLTWDDIADQMGYTPAHVRGKLHGKAINEARKIWVDLSKENTPEYKKF